MASITLKNIVVSNHSKVRVKVPNFTLHDKERIGIIGDNGSGKTTFLLVVAQLLKPTNGQVQPTKDWKVAVAFQRAEECFFEATVKDELGIDYQKQLQLFQWNECIDANRDPYSLSGGEARKVALAKTLSKSECFLLWDEPTNGLDYKGIQSLISILKRRTLGYIIVSHDLDFLIETCERIVAFENGMMIWDEAKEKVIFDEKKLHRVKHLLPTVAKIWNRIQSKFPNESPPTNWDELQEYLKKVQGMV
ncbi:MAG: energy-coupling factor ABC transporter ATP-binding protein [bacterium]|nr:energy-coupling factor ABC transporter ATP-binding protein [bacterium]